MSKQVFFIRKKDRHPVQYEHQDMNVVKKMGRYYLVIPFSSQVVAPTAVSNSKTLFAVLHREHRGCVCQF
jgi:hypothetical protein